MRDQRDERRENGNRRPHDPFGNRDIHHRRCRALAADLINAGWRNCRFRMAARLAQRLDQRLINGFVITLGTGLTVYFF